MARECQTETRMERVKGGVPPDPRCLVEAKKPCGCAETRQHPSPCPGHTHPARCGPSPWQPRPSRARMSSDTMTGGACLTFTLAGPEQLESACERACVPGRLPGVHQTILRPVFGSFTRRVVARGLWGEGGRRAPDTNPPPCNLHVWGLMSL
ncbi:hypothetical protein Bbelb_090670 [Branchiostoma belcheri]|nr:hypothetical protein Bbelb_090670 [Branchiostoma belcheri]